MEEFEQDEELSLQRQRWAAALTDMDRESQDKRIFEFIKAMKETTGTRGWRFMGHAVCRKGWTILTGVGHSRLQRVLHTIQSGATDPVDMRYSVIQARRWGSF